MMGDPQSAGQVGAQTRGTVFTNTGVDPRQPAPQPDAPVSSSDIIGANWTLSYQDMPGQPLQAEIDAYAPIINELDKRDTRTGIERILGPQYLTGVTRGMPVNVTKVWADVAAIRAKEPDFLKDIPATNYEEFAKWVRSREAAKRASAQDVVRREQGFGQKALGFGTGVVSSFADPINLGAMVLTGPVSGGAKSLLSVMGRDAITNMAIETAELPSIASNRAQFGEDMTVGDMLSDIGTAGVGGGAFGGATRGIHFGGRYVGSALADSDLGRAGQRFFAPWALGRANLGEAGDAEVARTFADSVPFAARTPDAQAGLYVLDRDTEVAGASPYVATPGGLDANAERLTGTATAISQPAVAGTVKPDVSRGTRPRDTAPLTQDRIIGFVLNDLEGGAKVVNNGDGGGTTKYGITQRWNPDVDVASLTEAQAASIARNKYWLPEFNRADPRVAAIAFDANYIATPALARRIISEAGDDVDRAMTIYREHLNLLAESDPGKARFKKAWNNRLDRLARFVGDAEASTVRLAPEGFEGDDVAYRAAQESLNAEELRLNVDGSFEADPVRDFADRVGRGDDVSGTADARFAADNADATGAEITRRADLGTDGHPDPLGGGVPRETSGDVSRGGPSEAETALAVRHYSEQATGEIVPEQLAMDLEISDGAARKALALAQRDPSFGQPKLWRETSPSDAIYMMPRSQSSRGSPFGRADPLWVANHPDLALGQGKNRGVLLEFDSGGLNPKADFSKPSARMVFDQHGQAEMLLPPPARGGFDHLIAERLRAITLKPDAKFSTRGDQFVMRNNLKRLEGLGWERSVAADGAITLRRPDELASFEDMLASTGGDAFDEAEAAGLNGPPPLDPSVGGVDDAMGAEAAQIADSLDHDVRAVFDKADQPDFMIELDGAERSLRDVLDELDRDAAAIKAAKDCL